jgi:hypothetical protein
LPSAFSTNLCFFLVFPSIRKHSSFSKLKVKQKLSLCRQKLWSFTFLKEGIQPGCVRVSLNSMEPVFWKKETCSYEGCPHMFNSSSPDSSLAKNPLRKPEPWFKLIPLHKVITTSIWCIVMRARGNVY